MKKFLLLLISVLALLSAVEVDAATDDLSSDAAVNAAIQNALSAKPTKPNPTPQSTKPAAILHARDSASQTYADIAIGVGASTLIKVPASGQIRVSNATLLGAQDLGVQVRLIGKKPGDVVVQAGDKTWRVSVLTADAWLSYVRLTVHLKNARGLTVRVRGGTARVEGRLLRRKDWQDLAQMNDLTYRFSAAIEDEMVDALRADVLKSLALAQLPAPSLEFSPEARVFLTQDQAALLPDYEKALHQWGFSVEINSTLVTLAPLVRIKILVAEVDKTFVQNLGINWQQMMSAQLLPTWVGLKQSSTVTLSLDALEQSGRSHILASPNLLCRSGKEAEFLAGGEFPIKITNFAAQDVTWKQYGVLLKVQPMADSVGHMSIEIKTEVSDIDDKHTVEGIPGVTTSRIQSHFDLAKPQTIALSGLIRKKTSDSASGLPFLSRIPILGQLFSSRAFNNDETELMIFVTPEVVHPEEGATI